MAKNKISKKKQKEILRILAEYLEKHFPDHQFDIALAIAGDPLEEPEWIVTSSPADFEMLLIKTLRENITKDRN